ncbi:MAG: NADH-quinone oxidoreductase subunit NuoK [Elusimicrobia bacterium]|nr:NADH-quinone oxidoreductase subunit NuoK [Elusimicrobiota bacterium]MBK7208392.1 NADH-quinone oxidoreductase subunit NuoK [Elusimicrobiota bacterium]MBK7545152.1 NADH-quinone oxidoreductase subunit NuoK [Elusimicrobiota bacterium]MBK7574673.1 NADH-quinone oxidoreductase subunit NuoK [Elusimicrobiota bacterium]MBK7688754.1 NADH-quinone oxidoreductase subunit NuoK [Elusimicrobiota bacterium]
MSGLFGYLVVGAVLLALGVYGALARRNLLGVLIGIELIFNAANINFVALNRYLHPGQPLGQAAAIFVIALAAAEAVVGLALVLTIYRNFRTVLSEDLNLLKG